MDRLHSIVPANSRSRGLSLDGLGETLLDLQWAAPAAAKHI